MIKKIILLLFCFFIFVTQSNSSTTIDAQVIRNQSGSGSTLISSGFPFPPGLVTSETITSGNIKILLNGMEVAANVTALRGRHNDNSLRSALIQFTVGSMAQGDIITAQVVVDGGVRATADPDYQRPTFDIVQNNNVILPTDTAYLASTLITFQKLLPVGNGTTAEEKQYSDLAETTFDSLVISQSEGAASYENVRAMTTLWARSGEVKYFNEAVSKICQWVQYNTPSSASVVQYAAINPDGRPDGGSIGIPSEPSSPRSMSYATMYLLTGYRDFWSIVAYLANWNNRAVTTQEQANTEVIFKGAYDTPRYNYHNRYGHLLAAYYIDATMPIQTPSYPVYPEINWANHLGWTLNAIKTAEWDLKWIPFNGGTGNVPAQGSTISQGEVSATLLGVYPNRYGHIEETGTPLISSGHLMVKNISGGSFSEGSLTGISANADGPEESDYREGMVGIRAESPRVNYLNYGYPVIPVFQFCFINNFLIDYYLNVYADSRIPDMVQRNVDAIIKQIRLMAPGDTYYQFPNIIWGSPVYGSPYPLKNPIELIGAPPYELPEYARAIAFVLKTKGESIVNGASYTTWYNRCIDTANNAPQLLTYQWKNFGQFYGFGADTPWIMAQSSLAGPSTTREPTHYTGIPTDTPDLQRSASQYNFMVHSGQSRISTGTGRFVQ